MADRATRMTLRTAAMTVALVAGGAAALAQMAHGAGMAYDPKTEVTIEGTVPALENLPPGCRFQNRCPHRVERCGLETPPLETVAIGVEAAAASGAARVRTGAAGAAADAPHEVACFRWREIEAP